MKGPYHEAKAGSYPLSDAFEESLLPIIRFNEAKREVLIRQPMKMKFV